MVGSNGELGEEEELVGRMMSHVMEVASMNSHEIGVVTRQEGETQWMSAQVKNTVYRTRKIFQTKVKTPHIWFGFSRWSH